MATVRQIAANRRNALKSTGPRSAAGKAVSCFNALKHGIDARSQCIPGENRATLEQLAAEYHERFAPTTPEQRCLVDTLVSCEWELRRYRAAGAQLWQEAAASTPTVPSHSPKASISARPPSCASSAPSIPPTATTTARSKPCNPFHAKTLTLPRNPPNPPPPNRPLPQIGFVP